MTNTKYDNYMVVVLSTILCMIVCLLVSTNKTIIIDRRVIIKQSWVLSLIIIQFLKRVKWTSHRRYKGSGNFDSYINYKCTTLLYNTVRATTVVTSILIILGMGDMLWGS